MTAPPVPVRVRTVRAAEIVQRARALLELEGPEALTMRRLADEVGIRAPSIYKHFPGKREVELALVEAGLAEVGELLHSAAAAAGSREVIAELLRAYRAYALGHPNLYQLATNAPLPGDAITPGLEAWAGEPFFLATGDPDDAQALWAFAHGMVALELDGRFPEGSDLDRTWEAGARAFSDTVARRPRE